MKPTGVIFAVALGIATAAFTAPAARAQSDDLIAKAKKEGSVSLYTIAPTAVAQAFGKQFKDKYGIDVTIFRAGGAQIEQKLSLEVRSRRVAADVVEIADPTAINQLAHKNAIANYTPANSAGLGKGLVDPQGRWTTIGQNIFILVYNKAKVKAEDAPKHYADLADPKWKGKLALASPNYGSTQLVFAKGLIEIGGWQLIDALKKNEAIVARGWPDLENLVATGERLVAPDISIRTIEALKKGANLGVNYPDEGIIAAQDVMGILAAAPHPNAARLLVEFYLSDAAQKFVAQTASYPVKASAGGPEGLKPLGELKLHYIDLGDLEAHHDDYVSRWTSTLER
jgi:iron(III) transport system substrate-binding protein